MWNKLSMTDKAQYIKLGVANGVTDLSTIRNAYNKYAEGGPTDTSGDTPSIDEDKLLNRRYFFEDWFSKRQDLLRQNAKDYYTSPSYYEDPYPDFFRHLDNVSEYYNSETSMAPTYTELAKKLPDFKTFNGDWKWSLEETLASPYVGGAYNKYAHAIGYNDPTPSVMLHERTHALNNVFSEDAIDRKLEEKNNNYIIKTDELSNYYDQPHEIYARLMQLRHDLKLDPTKRDYKASELMDKYGEDVLNQYDIFNRYSDEFIEFLLNDVAQNNTDNNPYNWGTDILSNNNYLT
jgi:hypothetical protein